jgi:hypothetical protein
MSDSLRKKYQEARGTLHRYEGTVDWSLIVGSGFSGATHPGAGKIFKAIMVGLRQPVYDSDCLYVNLSRDLFAISDAPGVTTDARLMLEELDRRLLNGSAHSVEAVVNDLNTEAGSGDRATLTMLQLVRTGSKRSFAKALAFIAGDTYLFHGNMQRGSMVQIHGSPHFWGTPYVHVAPTEIELSAGDFFVIASDGIGSAGLANSGERLEGILQHQMSRDPENFALNVTQRCNRVLHETDADRSRAWFGGYDDVSILAIHPDRLGEHAAQGSYFLGGYVGHNAA